MSQFRHILGSFAVVLSLAAPQPSPLRAQQVAPPPARPPLAQAASDLRQLVTAQEAYYAEHGRYAAEVGQTRFKASAGSIVRLVRPEADRYGAELTGANIDGSCVVHVGLGDDHLPRTAREHKVFPEGEPACDGDGETEDVRWASSAAFSVERVLASVAKLQERRFGRSGTYAATVEELEGFRADPSVRVTLEVTPASGRVPGFVATASHARYPNASCVVRSGTGPWMRTAMTVAQRRRPGVELQVTCDEFGK